MKDSGAAIDEPGVHRLDLPLAILCDEQPGHRQIDVSVDSDDRYAILFLSRNVTVGRLEISPVPEHRRPSGLVRDPIDLPPGAMEQGFDTIVVSAAAGDDPPVLGHLLVDTVRKGGGP